MRWTLWASCPTSGPGCFSARESETGQIEKQGYAQSEEKKKKNKKKTKKRTTVVFLTDLADALQQEDWLHVSLDHWCLLGLANVPARLIIRTCAQLESVFGHGLMLKQWLGFIIDLAFRGRRSQKHEQSATPRGPCNKKRKTFTVNCAPQCNTHLGAGIPIQFRIGRDVPELVEVRVAGQRLQVAQGRWFRLNVGREIPLVLIVQIAEFVLTWMVAGRRQVQQRGLLMMRKESQREKVTMVEG